MNSGSLLSLSSSQDGLCVDSNTPGAALPHVPCSGLGQTPADAPGSFTPSLAAHFDDNLIRHIQGWPSENIEKQVKKQTLLHVVLRFSSNPKAEGKPVEAVQPAGVELVRLLCCAACPNIFCSFVLFFGARRLLLRPCGPSYSLSREETTQSCCYSLKNTEYSC